MVVVVVVLLHGKMHILYVYVLHLIVDGMKWDDGNVKMYPAN